MILFWLFTGYQLNSLLVILLYFVWMLLGAFVRIGYSKFINWLENKLLKMNGFAQNQNNIDEEPRGGYLYACKLSYLTIECFIILLFISTLL